MALMPPVTRYHDTVWTDRKESIQYGRGKARTEGSCLNKIRTNNQLTMFTMRCVAIAGQVRILAPLFLRAGPTNRVRALEGISTLTLYCIHHYDIGMQCLLSTLHGHLTKCVLAPKHLSSLSCRQAHVCFPIRNRVLTHVPREHQRTDACLTPAHGPLKWPPRAILGFQDRASADKAAITLLPGAP